jgi:hypothetical protein
VLELADLCPRLAAVRWSGHALVRLHGAIGAHDGLPLRRSADADARLLDLAAGAGPVVVTERRVSGVLLATAERPALAWELDWVDVDDVSAGSAGGVLLLSTSLLAGVSIDPVGSHPILDLR